MMTHIRNIIFDLDDTLLDTTQQLLPIAGTAEFFAKIKSPLHLLPGALENLKALHRTYDLILLTFGDPSVQSQKILSCQIREFFKEIRLADNTAGGTKATHFQELSAAWPGSPAQFLSVGNRRSTDIREAKQSGMTTCLFSYGEHINETPYQPEDIPDYEIFHHRDLITTCKL